YHPAGASHGSAQNFTRCIPKNYDGPCFSGGCKNKKARDRTRLRGATGDHRQRGGQPAQERSSKKKKASPRITKTIKITIRNGKRLKTDSWRKSDSRILVKPQTIAFRTYDGGPFYEIIRCVHMIRIALQV